MKDPMRFEFDDDGVLHLTGHDGWREAICPLCEEPIRWVLDMASFLSLGPQGTYRLAHARCAWIPEAFDTQRELSEAFDRGDPQPYGDTNGGTDAHA